MKDILLVGIGGAFGAVARYSLGLALVRALGTGFPWATLFINLCGCLVIGLAMGGGPTGFLSRELRLLGVIGFLGAFTTFSTFGYETIALLQGGKAWLALAYVLASVVLGVALVALGMAVTRTWA